jgi:hypothetical protein
MTTIIDGTAGITFPNSTVQASAGQVLQVVNATTTTATTTTSATFVATNLSASITPKFSTSKILIQVTGPIDSAAANSQANGTIYRNSATNLGSAAGITNIFSSAGRVIGSLAMTFLDSPNTTSSTSYTVYINGSAGDSIAFPQGTNTATITLTEIAA